MPQDSQWQKLIDAVHRRMQTITVANGYETGIGEHCFLWRDLNAKPVTAEEQHVISIRDTRRESGVGGDWAKLNKHQHNLTVEIHGVASAGFSSPPDVFARKMIADIDKAIHADRYWTVEGVKLALETLPVEDAMEVSHSGDRIIGIRKTIQIIFTTALFNPYEA